jgi:hypothetical protein
MDESVIAAIAKWPNVPAVYGWLSLTQRGEWRLRGAPIGNPAICDFIGRNYAADERGRWFFQNGPQRVFVELESTPWVWRLGADAARPRLFTHTGAVVRELRSAWLDEEGRLFLRTEIGFGLVDSADTARAVEALRTSDDRPLADAEIESWCSSGHPPLHLRGATLGLEGDAALDRLRTVGAPEQFGYVRTPAP